MQTAKDKQGRHELGRQRSTGGKEEGKEVRGMRAEGIGQKESRQRARSDAR